MPFLVTVEGEDFNTDDLTLDEATSIEEATGESWLSINPFRSAAHARAIIVAFLSRKRSLDEAKKVAGAMSVKQTLEAVKHVDDDLPDTWVDGVPDPKAEGQ